MHNKLLTLAFLGLYLGLFGYVLTVREVVIEPKLPCDCDSCQEWEY